MILSRKLNMFTNLRLSYNKRIQHPSLTFINPYSNQEDRQNISFGNPELSPEISNNFELGYSSYIKGVVISSNAFFRQTNDIIQNVVTVDAAGVSRTTYDNVGTDKSFGANIFLSGTVKKIFQMRGYIELRQVNVDGFISGKEASNSGLTYLAHVGSTITLPWDLRAEVFTMLRSPQITLQGTQSDFWMYNLGLQKNVFGKRGSIGVRIANLFHKSIEFGSDYSGEGFSQSWKFDYPFRSYSASFSYKFGKLDFKQKERKNKVNNTDQKVLEENNF